MEHSHALQSSGPTIQHYRSSSNMQYRVLGMHGMSSTSLLATSTSEHPTTEMGTSNGVTAHPTVPFIESPGGGDGSATTHTNVSTWESNPYGEDGVQVHPPIGGINPPPGDPSPLSIHRNIDSVRRGNGLRHSPGSSVLQSPTIQNAAGIGGRGSASLSGTSSTAPSGTSGLPYPQRSKAVMARSVVVCGPAGIGKSSLILANQANWRSSGLWGYAKMVKGESSPFTGLVRHSHCSFWFGRLCD